jgi:hypothetical protein
MSHVVELDLAPSAAVETGPGAARHWLLGAVSGRDLLKAKLRKARPDMTVPHMRHAEELDHMLDYMIDVMGLRDWPEPATVGAKVRYLRTVLRMMIAIDKEQPLPDWRLAFH